MTNRYDLSSHLNDVYAKYPEAQQRPLIGITGNYEDLTCKLAEGYYKQVLAAGGTPVIVPPLEDTDAIIETLQRLDGLLLSGGADINPLYQDEQPSPALHGINRERDLPELLLTRLAYNRQLPILGICRGVQTLAIALGGKVAQDIACSMSANDKNRLIKHSQDADRGEATHSVNISEGSTLFNIYKASQLYVNSFHHQAVSLPGEKLHVVATAPDGVIEAVESTEEKAILGVQWHPECLDKDGLPLFQWLVGEARSYREAHRMHDRILSLDTHCDTPMFFPQGIHFAQRDDRILVDLQKMTEGRLDATIMVSYLPQPKPGETFAEKVSFQVDGPKDYADLIFDKIEAIVAQHPDHVALARNPNDLIVNKRMGRKSIMLGIENGLALDGQLENISHFADRGVVYITLCHNGDNDICDSCRGNNTHNGVSAFGEQVIGEMNRLGIMVDMSHAGDKSFFDALDISMVPIVCSHSSARSLCNHPRNLTDDQMRALAKKGGVCQITLYNGFLKAQGEATIHDAIAHLEHAISVMGIDHVGLGTDFDGDGGVRGLADASELIHFTRMLMARRYSEADIQKIWGGNFLRVMTQVQQMKEKK